MLALAGVIGWQADDDSAWQRVAYKLLSELWIPFGLVALLLFCYTNYLRPRLARELTNISGPAIVGSMQPQQLMELFLGSVYGTNEANRDVVTAMLGRDLTISTDTSVGLRLSAVDSGLYRLGATATYRFHHNVRADRFVYFATCDPRLRDSIVQACEFPLFDLWFTLDRSLFTQSTDNFMATTEISIDYLGSDDRQHSASFRDLRTTEVKYQDWPRYLPLFRGPIGSLQQQHARDYLSSLRIFDCSFTLPNGDSPAVRSVERLSVRQSGLEQIDDGFCYWQAPYPCYIDHIEVDTRDFDVDGTRIWEFNAMPFSFRASNAATSWLPPEQLSSIDLHSWLLPGHGVALLWRDVRGREL
ncbi:hypothetical protein [Amycolatopsis sp.]|uniref:hypothetical protein n=1 Tax=Amycolatopsis sp. TaxID=37632 RepID=UPI002BDAF209|nr:hypothetical protein [Amycolatopsis sp.]HVV12749.1 hypothetical protein [Amycolatopsis sp.]